MTESVQPRLLEQVDFVVEPTESTIIATMHLALLSGARGDLMAFLRFEPVRERRADVLVVGSSACIIRYRFSKSSFMLLISCVVGTSTFLISPEPRYHISRPSTISLCYAFPTTASHTS